MRRGLALLVLGGLVLAGCADNEPSDRPEPARSASPTSSETRSPTTTASTPTRTTSSAPSTTSPTPLAVPSGIVNAIAALGTAAAAVPEGQPFDVERETVGGEQVWDIKVGSSGRQFTVLVSLDDAPVVRQSQDQTPDDDVQKLAGASLSAVEALRAAAEQQAGDLAEMEIDSTGDGTVIWQVDLRQGNGSVVEVNLDANTGSVVTRRTGE